MFADPPLQHIYQCMLQFLQHWCLTIIRYSSFWGGGVAYLLVSSATTTQKQVSTNWSKLPQHFQHKDYRHSLKVIKQLHILIFQWLLPFKIFSLLCGEGIITISMNNFLSYICFILSLVIIFILTQWSYRNINFRTLKTLALHCHTGFMHTWYLRGTNHHLHLKLNWLVVKRLCV